MCSINPVGPTHTRPVAILGTESCQNPNDGDRSTSDAVYWTPNHVQQSSKTILLNTAAANAIRYILIFINVIGFRVSFSIVSKNIYLVIVSGKDWYCMCNFWSHKLWKSKIFFLVLRHSLEEILFCNFIWPCILWKRN